MKKEIQVSSVEFYGKTLSTINQDGIKYVAVRPIVEGMGLDWKSQSVKLNKNKNKFNCGVITTVASDGKKREMLCVPFTKL